MRLSAPHATTFLILLPFLSGVLSDPQLPLPAQSGFRRAQHLRKKDLLGNLLGGTTASEAPAPGTANMAAGQLDSRTTSEGLLGGLVGDLTGQSVTSLATLPSSSTTMAVPTGGVVTTGLITAQATPSSILSSSLPLVTANATSSAVNGTLLASNASSTASESDLGTSTVVVVVQATPSSTSSMAGNLNSSGCGRRAVGAGWIVAFGAAGFAVLSV